MKSFIAAVVAMAAVATAAPSLQARDLCPSFLYSVPQCCSTNVLNVASLDCKNPGPGATCSSGSLQCCSVPLAQQALLCNPAVI